MKFNWGTGIFLFYVIFVGSLAFQVYKSTQYDNSLVVDNYYEQDLDYQTQYNKAKNSLSLSERLSIDYQEDKKVLAIDFPQEINEAKGEVLFYRADDKSKDLTIKIHKTNNEQLEIPVNNLPTGEWQISIDWTSAGKAYFDKKIISI